VTCSEQIHLLPECLHKGRAALHGSQVTASAIGDVAEVSGTVVGHGMMLKVSPDAFDGIHIRCVSRQVVDHDLAALGFDVRALLVAEQTRVIMAVARVFEISGFELRYG
jgi:hypothetical protein